jgi:hypothetical protein
MEPALAIAISICMRVSLNWRVRYTHASLPLLVFFIFLYELKSARRENAHWSRRLLILHLKICLLVALTTNLKTEACSPAILSINGALILL